MGRANEKRIHAAVFLGESIESDWQVGSSIKSYGDDGATHMHGKILQCEPPRLLSYNFQMVQVEESRNKKLSHLTFEIEPFKDVVKLIVTHEGLTNNFEEAIQGWQISMSSLKTLLETGRALSFGG